MIVDIDCMLWLRMYNSGQHQEMMLLMTDCYLEDKNRNQDEMILSPALLPALALIPVIFIPRV